MRSRIDGSAAASGALVIVFGIAGASFERGSPPANASIDQVVLFWSTYRRELLWQSLLASLAAIASGAHAIMTLGIVAQQGPLVPGGALTYALYALLLAWLIATVVVMTFFKIPPSAHAA